MPSSDPQRSVDDLRARLRELGYLDAGIDRFVLGSVRGGRGLARLAWSASLRIGALAALLLGPSAAVALGVRLPGLVTGVRDAVVLAAYLGALFGAGVVLAAFAVSVAVGTLAGRFPVDKVERRSRLVAGVASSVVAAACLVYLVFWWRAVTPVGSAPLSAAWTWPVLAVAAGVSVLLGHAVRLTTLALVAGQVTTALPALRLSSRSWAVRAGLVLVAVLAAASLLFFVSRGETPRASGDVPAFAATPTGVTLTVIGVDGFDAGFVDRLRGAGRIPVLSRLLGGARGTLPPSDAPDPARTWTSLATGQPADVHGVSGIEARRVSGLEGTMPAGSSGLGATIAAATDLLRLTRPTLTTGLQRRTKTFWEVAAEHRVPIVVVNWWATWPAAEKLGTVLTDRATLRLERGGPLDAEIEPASLYPGLAAAWPAIRDEARRRVLAAFPENDETAGILRRAGEQDALPLALLERLGAQEASLKAVYLPGLDIAQHDLLAGGSGLPASAMAARVEALERYYVFLDHLLEPLTSGDSPNRLVALIADPGRAAAASTGVVSLSGAVARPTAPPVSMTRADLVPTLLYTLGVPASRELPGKPRTDLFTDQFTSRVPVRWTESYGRRTMTPRPPSAAPLDDQMLERLRSLGYVR